MIKLVEIQAATIKQIELQLIQTIEVFKELGFRFVTINNVIVTNGHRIDDIKTVALFIKD